MAVSASSFSMCARAGPEDATPVIEDARRFHAERQADPGHLDPYGHRWNIATHIEDVPPERMEQRAAAAMSGG
jgi:PhnB protein